MEWTRFFRKEESVDQGVALASEPDENPIASDDRPFRPRGYLEEVREGFCLWFKEREFGCSSYRTVARYLAARTFDLNFSVAVDGDEEQAFVDDLIERNDFRGELGTWLALLGVIQEQCAIKISVENGEIVFYQMPVVDLKSSWGGYPQAYKATIDGEVKGLKSEEHELVKLSGVYKYQSIPNEVINTMPALANAYPYCVSLDTALDAIKKVNDLYARPTLVTEHKTFQEKNKFIRWAKGLIDPIADKVKWAIGQMLQLVTAKSGPSAYFIQPDNSGVDALAKQSEEAARALSSLTGIPMQKLGRPDLPTNRSISDLSEDATLFDQFRNIWEKSLLELFRKAARLSNATGLTTSLDPEKIKKVSMNTLPPDLLWAQEARLAAALKEKFITRLFYLENHPMVEDAKGMDDELSGVDRENAAALVDALRARQDTEETEEGGEE